MDSAGNVVPNGDNEVTFSLSGAGTIAGTANGDPTCHVNNKSPSRPAFHGLVSAVILVGDDNGLVRAV